MSEGASTVATSAYVGVAPIAAMSETLAAIARQPTSAIDNRVATPVVALDERVGGGDDRAVTGGPHRGVVARGYRDLARRRVAEARDDAVDQCELAGGGIGHASILWRGGERGERRGTAGQRGKRRRPHRSAAR